MNIIAALLFVIGCLLFYSPSAQSAGITFFLVGSALFLASALGDALLRFGPTEQ